MSQRSPASTLRCWGFVSRYFSVSIDWVSAPHAPLQSVLQPDCGVTWAGWLHTIISDSGGCVQR